MYYTCNLLLPEFPAHEGGPVDRVFFLGGIVSVAGGFAMILYQGIMFLKDGEWRAYPVLSFIDTQSGALAQFLTANQAIADALQKCPMSAAYIALGLILLWVAGKLRNRYA